MHQRMSTTARLAENKEIKAAAANAQTETQGLNSARLAKRFVKVRQVAGVVKNEMIQRAWGV
jgi:hypothetical protein